MLFKRVLFVVVNSAKLAVLTLDCLPFMSLSMTCLCRPSVFGLVLTHSVCPSKAQILDRPGKKLLEKLLMTSTAAGASSRGNFATFLWVRDFLVKNFKVPGKCPEAS